MKKQFIPYELAVKLKELGFDEQCLAVYINNKLTIEDDWLYSTNKDTFIESTNCTAPLWQQAFDWFRKKHNLHSHLDYDFIMFTINIYDFKNGDIIKISQTLTDDTSPKTISLEEARLECLKKLIEMAEKK